ncbi:aldehyde dehydrogenase family protein [Mycobacterium spongiae]|nr:aldehyde dehydrogenase family protein [Mycobacterium spongiae]
MDSQTRDTPAAIPVADAAAPDSVVRRIEVATARFRQGRTRSLEWRRDQLDRLAEFVSKEEHRIQDAVRQDLGRPEFETYLAELWPLLLEIRDARKHLKSWAAPRRVPTPLELQPGSGVVQPEPLGVALIIGPWNLPVNLVLAPLVAAIAAGNCAVLKPSELSPTVSALLAERLPRYLDPECFPVVQGGVAETTVLLKQRFDHIFYTGGAPVGRLVMAAAALHLTPTTLELGGKSPVIVDDSAKLQLAAKRIVWGSFMNAGQLCVAPDYILVSEHKRDALVAELKSAIEEYFGPDPQASPYFGRIINERHFDRLSKLIAEDKVAHGGDTDRSDKYIAPTLLTGVTEDDAVMQEEVFGPVLPIITVRDTDDAIRFVNSREKPLALYVFAEDRQVQDRVIAQTTAGGVTINHTVLHIAHGGMPFGGVGASGMGAYHGKWGFDTFSHLKPVLKKATWIDPPITSAPYSGWKRRALGLFT